MFSKGNLFVLGFGIGVGQGTGRRGDIDKQILEFFIGCNFLSCHVDVDGGQNDEELHSEVTAAKEEDDVRVVPVEFASCKHEREHDHHFIECHFSFFVFILIAENNISRLDFTGWMWDCKRNEFDERMNKRENLLISFLENDLRCTKSLENFFRFFRE